MKIIISELENFKGKWIENESGIPFDLLPEVVEKAISYLYKNKLIINFSWTKWEEGKRFYYLDITQKIKRLDNLDINSIVKYFTAISRNDRFSGCSWGNLFESGFGLLLYKKLLECAIANKETGEEEIYAVDDLY